MENKDTNNKSPKLILSLLSFAVLLIVGFSLIPSEYEINVYQKDVQATIDKKIEDGFIVSHKGIDVIVNSAEIDFKENHESILNVDFSADGYKMSGDIKGSFEFGLTYDSGKLFLSNLLPLNVEVNPDRRTGRRITAVKAIASDYLSRKRDEMLSEESKVALDHIVSDGINKYKIVSQNVAIKLFETYPIYDLNNSGIKGRVIGLALDDIVFNEGYITISLSASKAILNIIMFLVILVLAVIGGIGTIAPFFYKNQ